MPTSAIKALATLTLSSAQATVTFSSITNAFQDLRLVVQFAGSGPGSGRLRINNDTFQDNHYAVRMLGDGSSASSGVEANSFFSISTSGGGGVFAVDMLDYSATNKQKTMLGRYNLASGSTEARVYRYASTAAITRIDFINITGGDTYPAGSTFTLYGVSA